MQLNMKIIKRNMKLNFELICRVCLERSENMLSIFTQDGSQLLAEKIADCGGIVIESQENGNHYPKNICPKCIAFLNIAHKFRITCKNSDSLLRSLLPEMRDEGNISKSSLSEGRNKDELELDFCNEGNVIIQLETNIDEIIENNKVDNFLSNDSNQYFEIQTLENDDSDEDSNNEIIIHEMCTKMEQPDNSNDDIERKIKNNFLKIEKNKNSNNARHEKYELCEDTNQYYIEEDILDEKDVSVNKDSNNVSGKYSIKNICREQNRFNLHKNINDNDGYLNSNENHGDLPSSFKKRGKTLKKSVAKKKLNKITSAKRDGSAMTCKKKSNDFICEVCGNKYNKKALFDSHMRWHSEEKDYKCEVCGRAFTINFQLTRHMRVHTGDKPYSCDICGRKFSDYSTCKKHKRTHTDERSFKCEICKKGFNYAHVLRIHMSTHTGEKPYACDQCNKKFSQPHHLKAHLTTLLHKSGNVAAITTTLNDIKKQKSLKTTTLEEKPHLIEIRNEKCKIITITTYAEENNFS